MATRHRSPASRRSRVQTTGTRHRSLVSRRSATPTADYFDLNTVIGVAFTGRPVMRCGQRSWKLKSDRDGGENDLVVTQPKSSAVALTVRMG